MWKFLHYLRSNTDNLNFFNLQAKYLCCFQELTKQINLKNKIKPYTFSLTSKMNLKLMIILCLRIIKLGSLLHFLSCVWCLFFWDKVNFVPIYNYTYIRHQSFFKLPFLNNHILVTLQSIFAKWGRADVTLRLIDGIFKATMWINIICLTII